MPVNQRGPHFRSNRWRGYAAAAILKKRLAKEPAMKNTLRIITLSALACIQAAMFSQAQDASNAGPRFALVIGNGAYQGQSALKNPVNDATDVAAAFKRLGYSVDLLINADQAAMETASARLTDNLSANPQSLGVFYYAGHGIQSQGVNYLIPVGANIPAEAFLKTKALSAQTVLDLMQNAGNKLNLVILDACRDNPFSWSRGAGTRGLSVVPSQPPGSVLVYATSAGGVAQDGTGRNGLFTQELLKNVETPGIDLNTVLDRTAAGVQKASANKQNPAVYKQYFGTAYLGSAPAAQATAAPALAQGNGGVTIGAAKPSTGSLEVSLASPGKLTIAGQTVDSQAGIVPISGLAPGAVAVSIVYADGKIENAAAMIEAGKTAKVGFGYVAAAFPNKGPNETWITLGDKSRYTLDEAGFDEFYSLKDFFPSVPGTGYLYKAFQGGKLKDSWWVVVQEMPANLGGAFFYATSYKPDAANTTVHGLDTGPSLNLNGWLIGSTAWLGLPQRFSGDDEVQFPGDSSTTIRVAVKKVGTFQDRKGTTHPDCVMFDISQTNVRGAFYTGIIILQRDTGILYASGAIPDYLEGKAYQCELSEVRKFEKQVLSGKIVDKKKRYGDPLFGLSITFHSFGKVIFKTDTEGKFSLPYYGDELGVFYGVFTKDPWGSIYPVNGGDNKFILLKSNTQKGEIILEL
jgi:hypothetical protein